MKGFSLLELLIVIGVIGILVAAGVYAYTQFYKQSRDTKRRADIQAMAEAVDQYYLANGQRYPTDTGCFGAEAYLQNKQLPTGYDLSNSCDSVTGNYCLCALMEVAGSGNASGRTGAVCNWQKSGGNYFCIGNKQ